MNRKLLRNDQWERIKDLLPGQKGDPGQISRATDCSLKLCCGLHGLGHLGATCFLPLATVSTRGTPVRAKKRGLETFAGTGLR